MLLRTILLLGFLNIISARRGLFISPSSPTICSPNISTTFLNPILPEWYIFLATRSACIMSQEHISLRSARTEDFPAPTPPVIPITFISVPPASLFLPLNLPQEEL